MAKPTTPNLFIRSFVLSCLFILSILYTKRTSAQCTASLTAVGSTNICWGSSAILQAGPTGLYDYQWFINNVPANIGDTQLVFTPNYGDTGTFVFTVQITDFNNCTVISNPVSVHVYPYPDAMWATALNPGCIGDTMGLTVTVYPDTTGVSFAWIGPNGFTANTQTAYIPSMQAANAGTYMVAVSNLGCADTQYISIDTFGTIPPGSYAYWVTSGMDSTLCSGEWLQIQAQAGGLITATHTWTGPNSFSYTGESYFFMAVTAADSGEYIITTTGNDCYTTYTFVDTVVAYVSQAPTVTVASNGPVCAGNTLNFSATVSNATSYHWDGPDMFTSTALSNSIPNMQMVNSGNYAFTASYGVCDLVTFIDGGVLPNNPSISHYYPDSGHIFCAGEYLYIHCFTDSMISPDFVWTGPNGFISNLDQLWTYGLTNADSGLYVVSVTDTNCNGPFTLTDTFLVDVRPCIWPGDVNYDLTADNIDVLDLGLAYANTGMPRPIPSNAWTGAYLADWGTPQFCGPDMKHADCNGNGIITASDTNAISLNYTLTHNKGLHIPQAKSASNADLYFDMTGITLTPGTTVSIPIKLGTSTIPMANIYGLAAQVKINGITPPGGIIVTAPAGWMGSIADAMNFNKWISDNQTDWAYVRTDHNNASGDGIIAIMQFTVPMGSDYQQIQFYFDNVKIIGNTGNVITNVNIIDGGATIFPTNTMVSNHFINDAVVLPNPSEGQATLQLSAVQAGNVHVLVTDITGRNVWNTTVATAAGIQPLRLPTEVAPGMYTIQVKDEKGALAKTIKWVKK